MAAYHSMNKRMDKAESLWKLRGIHSDAPRAASGSGEFIASGQANTPLSIGDWSVSRKRNAPGIVPPSRRRSGCSPAAPYLPARQIDCLQETGRKSIIKLNRRRGLYRRGVKLLTFNKERT
jgi:hypothetical protein